MDGCEVDAESKIRAGRKDDIDVLSNRCST